MYGIIVQILKLENSVKVEFYLCDVVQSSNLNVLYRLDAGTFGTMGVGPGFAIAAAVLEQTQKSAQRVVCIEGDSAFGFSGMEVETMCR